MKFLLIKLIFFLILFNVNIMNSDIPKPLHEKEFSFPEYKVRYLSNSLRIILVDNKKQPFLYFKMLIGGGTSAENIPGIAELTSNILTKGTKRYNAKEIASELDLYGGSLFLSANTDYISVYGATLNKHLSKYLDIFADVLVNPTFPSDEYEKLKINYKSSVNAVKSDPKVLSNKLSQKVLFGDNHPYANIPHEKYIETITTSDLIDYYEDYFNPNNATLAIIGDMDENDLIDMLEDYLKNWNIGNKLTVSIPEPIPSDENLFFIERDSSKQTNIKVVIDVCDFNDEDRLKLKIASKIIGDSFSGRLFKSLREEYNYSYDPFGGITGSKVHNVFFCGAAVNNDSIIHTYRIIHNELDRLIKEKIDSAELERIKKHYAGNFLMSLEEPESILSLILIFDFMKNDKFDLKEKLKKIEEITPEDIQSVAKKYLHKRNRNTVIVGDSIVKKNLTDNFRLAYYNKELEETGINDFKYEIDGLAPQDIINNYIESIGGKEALDTVNTLFTYSEAEIIQDDSRVTGKLLRKQKKPLFMYQDLSFGHVNQRIWVNSDSVMVSFGNDISLEADSSKIIEYRRQAKLFNIVDIIDDADDIYGFYLKDGFYQISLKLNDNITEYYFDKDEFLLNKIIILENNIITQIHLSEYTSINSIKLPLKEEIISKESRIILTHQYSINSYIDDAAFIPY